MPIMTPMQNSWRVKKYLFVKETSSSTFMETARCLVDLLWVQLKKYASLMSWPLD